MRPVPQTWKIGNFRPVRGIELAVAGWGAAAAGRGSNVMAEVNTHLNINAANLPLV